MSCSGENCNSIYIQNKKYNLCGECVFRKNNKGRSKQEVYKERSEKKQKLIPVSFKIVRGGFNPPPQASNKNLHIDEEAQKNIVNQDEAERRQKEEDFANFEGFLGKRNPIIVEEKTAFISIKKKPKQISSKQAEINKLYKLTCIDMDYTTEPVCTGCLRYQGGDIKLSHSHIISREDCKRIGRPELIYDRRNITYHDMDFGEHEGCHRKWENPVLRSLLNDYDKNIQYIKSISEELYLKYSAHERNK